MIDKLIKTQGEFNKTVLISWLQSFNLSTAKAAELLQVNKRTLENWRCGRYKIPSHLIHAFRAVENNLK